MDVERIIRNAIVAVLNKNPFYGHIVCQFPKVFTDSIPTLAVGKSDKDGLLVNLYVNPSYVEDVYSRVGKEQAFYHFTEVIKHEILHVVFRHLFLDKPDKQRQRIATELAVNSFLNRSKLVDKGIFPEDYKLKDRLGFDVYYNSLPDMKNKPELPKNNTGKKGEPLDSHDLWKNIANDEQTEMILKDIVRKAYDTVKSTNQWGNTPAEVLEAVQKQLEPKENKVPWQVVLREFIASSSETILNYTNKKTSKRYGTRPGTKKEDTLNLAIGIDTSGSVDLRTIEMFFSEIHWIAKSNVKITVFECDCTIHREYSFRYWDKSSVSGRGGTDLEPVFKEISSRKFDALIYFTDAEAPTIKTNYNIPTMFVIGGCSYHTSRKTLPYPADIVFRVHENGEVESW